MSLCRPYNSTLCYFTLCSTRLLIDSNETNTLVTSDKEFGQYSQSISSVMTIAEYQLSMKILILLIVVVSE
jgi:hypothetical protein